MATISFNPLGKKGFDQVSVDTSAIKQPSVTNTTEIPITATAINLTIDPVSLLRNGQTLAAILNGVIGNLTRSGSNYSFLASTPPATAVPVAPGDLVGILIPAANPLVVGNTQLLESNGVLYVNKPLNAQSITAVSGNISSLDSREILNSASTDAQINLVETPYLNAVVDLNSKLITGVRTSDGIQKVTTGIEFDSLQIKETDTGIQVAGSTLGKQSTELNNTTLVDCPSDPLDSTILLADDSGKAAIWQDSKGSVSIPGLRTNRDVSGLGLDSSGNVYFVKRDNNKLQIFSKVGSTITQLTTVGNNFDPVVSGSTIYFYSDRCGGTQLWSMTTAGASQAPVVGINTQDTLVHFIGFGQSLSLGSYSGNALSTTQIYGNLKIGTDHSTISALTEPVQSALGDNVGLNANCETMHSSMGNWLSAYALRNGSIFRSIHSTHGINSAALNTYNKGTTAYSNARTAIAAAKSYATTNGLNYIIGGVTLINGEADQLNASFASQIAQFFTDINVDFKADSGQSSTIPLFLAQVARSNASNISATQQMSAILANPDIVMVAPECTLEYTYGGAQIHIANTSEQQLGEYFAKAAFRKLVEGINFKPLYMKSATRTGSIIVVKFNVPVPPLRFDPFVKFQHPSGFITNTNMGLEYADDSSSATISSSAITGEDEVTITLSVTPTGANKKIRSCWTPPGYNFGVANHVAVPYSPFGNSGLCDSDFTFTLNGYKSANYLTAHEINVA